MKPSRPGLLFPGQGAQTVGMGADFSAASPAARSVYEEADQILGLPLARLCFEGPLEELTRTDMAQPAIYTTGLAALAALEESLGEALVPGMAAGLSLGEYTALAAAGALAFADGLRLVRLRGEAMQAASVAPPSGMSSVLGLELSSLEELCAAAAQRSGAVCQVANRNSPGQIVVSGALTALDCFEELARGGGARRVLRLNVAGAFHSELMRPASERLAAALAETPFRRPVCPVWQNATAHPEQDPAALRQHLVEQLTSPVLWEDSFRDMAQWGGRALFLEAAPGRVLAGLARKIDRNATVLGLHHVDVLSEIAAAWPRSPARS